MANETENEVDLTTGAHFSPLGAGVMICLILVLGGIVFYQQYQLNKALDMINLLSGHIAK